MNKIEKLISFSKEKGIHQTLLKMKLLGFIILISVLHVSGESYSQQTRLDLNYKNYSIKQILSEIENQSQYKFFYPSDLIDVDKRIDVKIKDKDILHIMEEIFKDESGIIFKVVEENLVVISSEEAQQKTITGRVTDKDGIPLPGVTIVIKGTTQGTISDTNGNFILKNVGQEHTLVFSFVGLETKEVLVGTQSTVIITMFENTVGLDEVVAIGYGTMKKSDITGAVSSINAGKLDRSAIKSIDQMLQGKSSGVYMTQNSGMPGSASTVRIRGGNSISGGNEPLYVIDGIPIYSGTTNSQTSLSPLNSIATSDIESIEILKDASSTAIYGARGANGVILITTKHGKAGKTNITFDSYIGIQNPSKTYDLLNATEYEKYVNEAEINGGGVAIYDKNMTPVNTDWQNLCLADNAIMQNHTLSLSGGDNKTRFLTTFNLVDQDGIIKATDLTKMTLRINLDKEISNAFKYTLNLSMAQVNSNRVGNSVLTSMVTLPPNIPLYWEDGTYRDVNMVGDTFVNPLAKIDYNTNWSKQFRVLCNTGLEWNIVKGLTLKSTWGVDLDFGDNQYYTAIIAGAESTSGDAYVSATKSYMWLNENTLTFDKTIGDHHVNILGGLMQQTSKTQSVTARSQGYLNDNLAMYDLGSGVNNLPSNSSTYEWSLLSYLGRINYGFKGKYLTTLSIRADGSSRFGKNNRWGYFPSIAFAWRASEEEFIKSLSLFSNLKLRVSHGWTGNQDGIGIYPSMALLGKMTYGLGNTKFIGYGPTQVANYNLKWETTQQTDLGIEMGFLNNRLNITADAYYKKTSDLLLSVVIPSTSGYTKGLKNIGEVENKGVELGANVIWLDNKFKWETAINITFNKNKVVSLGEVSSLVPTAPAGDSDAGLNVSRLLKVGEPLGIFYGYRSDGIFSTTDDIANSAQPTAQPGDIRFKDISGPEGVPDNVISDSDRDVIGCAQPKFFGGITNTFSYKNFNLMINMVGTYGNDIYNATNAVLESLNGWNNQSRTIINRWTPSNQNTKIPRAVNVKLTSRSWDHLIEDQSLFPFPLS